MRVKCITLSKEQRRRDMRHAILEPIAIVRDIGSWGVGQ
jgi:hypothetical protein